MQKKAYDIQVFATCIPRSSTNLFRGKFFISRVLAAQGFKSSYLHGCNFFTSPKFYWPSGITPGWDQSRQFEKLTSNITAINSLSSTYLCNYLHIHMYLRSSNSFLHRRRQSQTVRRIKHVQENLIKKTFSCEIRERSSIRRMRIC